MSADRPYGLFEEKFTVQKGDRILLTSDGFHSKLLRGAIAAISASHADFSSFWDAIEQEASRQRWEDDATCLAIEIE